MKSLFATLIFSLLCLNIIAQSSLVGKVIDQETKEPLLFANLLLTKGKNQITTYTDFDGRFEFKHLEAGDYTLSISYTGYISEKWDKIMIPKGQEVTHNIALFESAAIESPVIAQGEKEMEEVIVVKDRIAGLPGKNVSHLKGKVAGVMVTGSKKGKAKKKAKKKADSASTASSIMIRGMSTSSETSTINGMKVIGDLHSEEAEKKDIPSGQLTAGEWSDLDHWETWKEVVEEDFASYADQWKLKPSDRYAVEVKANGDRPLPNCILQLIDSGNEVIWEAKTDHAGRAELWANIFSKNRKVSKIKAIYKDKDFEIKNPKPIEKGLNKIQFPVGCIGANIADICLVIDATSSMSDEIHYLKAEMQDVLQRVYTKNPDITIRTGAVFYRDHRDEYLSKRSPFSENGLLTSDFIKQQYAAGGGDIPEAVDAALDVAINQMEWNPEAINRLMFLVLDAPPHQHQETIDKVRKLMQKAAKMGIKIIPLTASGIKKDTEYLMKAMAITTNSTYTFLTDDSGIGNEHLEVTADVYDVKFLNDLMVEIINRYLAFEDCPELEEQKPATRPAIVKDPNLQQFIECFPNPAIDYVNIRLEEDFDGLIIRNSLGQLVLQKEELPTGETTLQLQNWPAGIYYLEFRKADKITTEKLVIQSDK